MTATIPTPTTPALRIAPAPRRLLACGAVGFPVWSVVSLTQAATRAGFDLRVHPLSALSTGPLGWLQITNFFLAGMLTVLGAVGLRRALPDTPWPGRLFGVAGVGMIGAAVLVMDPPPGFNAPTDEVATSMSWHSLGHMVAGSITFLALIAACVVLGPRLSQAGHRGLALASYLAGTALLVGDAWAVVGGPMGSLTLAVGAITAMLWTSGVCAVLARRA